MSACAGYFWIQTLRRVFSIYREKCEAYYGYPIFKYIKREESRKWNIIRNCQIKL
jgi:hypothetical protein